MNTVSVILDLFVTVFLRLVQNQPLTCSDTLIHLHMTHTHIHPQTDTQKLAFSCIFIPLPPFRARLEELRMFLENETWELCPVKSNFNIAQLHVSTNHISEAGKWSVVAFIYSTLPLISHPHHPVICIRIMLLKHRGTCVFLCGKEVTITLRNRLWSTVVISTFVFKRLKWSESRDGYVQLQDGMSKVADLSIMLCWQLFHREANMT